MDGICVEDCKLLLMEHIGNGRYENAEVDLRKGKMVQIGDLVTNIGGNNFVELVVQDPRCDWDNEYYMIKKSDRDKFFKRVTEEVVQCESFEAMSRSRGYESASCFVNEFLRKIRPESIVSCGYSGGRFWVYYKTFIEKGWEE